MPQLLLADLLQEGGTEVKRPILLVRVGAQPPDLYTAHHAPRVGEIIDIKHGDGRVDLRVRVIQKRVLENRQELYSVEEMAPSSGPS